jgi:hypothetical protein
MSWTAWTVSAANRLRVTFAPVRGHRRVVASSACRTPNRGCLNPGSRRDRTHRCPSRRPNRSRSGRRAHPNRRHLNLRRRRSLRRSPSGAPRPEATPTQHVGSPPPAHLDESALKSDGDRLAAALGALKRLRLLRRRRVPRRKRSRGRPGDRGEGRAQHAGSAHRCTRPSGAAEPRRDGARTGARPARDGAAPCPLSRTLEGGGELDVGGACRPPPALRRERRPGSARSWIVTILSTPPRLTLSDARHRR